MGDLWNLLIVQPIFNLLALIYALIPGHNFGLAIIIFTVTVRLLMWPLVKKQLHQVKVMRKIQPELKRIKAAAKGDRRKESMLMMELYRERGISPFGPIGIMLLQVPILIGLYVGLRKVIQDPAQMVDFAYPFIQHLGWMQQLNADVHLFDATLFGAVDLSRAALSPLGTYWPAMLIVIGSAVVQFYQSRQLTPSTKDGRKLRQILKEANTGKQADQSEVNAAVGRSTRFLLPALVFFFTVRLASALSLYWLVSGLTAVIQQGIVLKKDEEEMEAAADKPATTKTSKISTREKNAVEAEVVADNIKKKPAPRQKRRKR